jgi:hypothetical protein
MPKLTKKTNKKPSEMKERETLVIRKNKKGE